MPSKSTSNLLDLVFSASPEESEALWRARTAYPITDEQYLRFLLAAVKDHPPTREIPEFHEPFVL